MQHLQIGTTLQGGKYRIDSVLGQGGFGITYLVTQPLMLDRKLAIKEFFLKDYFTRNETTARVTCSTASTRNMADQYRHKFIKEAQMLLQISHPYLVKVLDIFEENDTAYYVMEYAEGITLSQLVKDRGPLPEDEAVGYVLKIAEVLGFIHTQRVTHLDVKPSNVILNPANGDIRLIDFGASKHYDAKSGEHTTIATPVYSPGYAPFEQYKQGGVSAFSPQSDIYALGATLYKLVTGTTPPEPSELISHPLAGFPATLSSTARGTILLAMQLNRDDRPQTIAEFTDYLTGKKEIPADILNDDNEHTLVINEKPQIANNQGIYDPTIAQLQNALEGKTAHAERLEAENKRYKANNEILTDQISEARNTVAHHKAAWIVLLLLTIGLGFYAFSDHGEKALEQKFARAAADADSTIARLNAELADKDSTLARLKRVVEEFGASKLIAGDISVKNDGEDYGETIYSRNTTYIYPRVEITSLISGEVTIYAKFITPYGLSQGDESPRGYTYSESINVSAYQTETFYLTGWGGTDKGHWAPGSYRYEFYYDGNLIGKKSFTIY